MSKVWSRLGAAVGSVALLVSGLLGVAAPAQADHLTITKTSVYDFGSQIQVVIQANKMVDGDGNYYVSATEWEHCQQEAEKHFNNTNPNAGDYYSAALQKSQQYSTVFECTLVKKLRATEAECEADGKVLNEAGTACRDKTAEEECEDSGKYWYDNSCNEKSPSENQCSLDGDVWEDGECREWEEVVDIEMPGVGGLEGADGQLYTSVFSLDDYPQAPTPEHVLLTLPDGVTQMWGIPASSGTSPGVDGEPVQKTPPPPPCWSGEAGNNCPVGGALRFAAPQYAMVGVPVTMYAYASWRPDANSPAQPTNGTAVIRVDGEDYSGVEFKDGVAEWRFIPETEGMKEFTASGVVSSGLSGANAYIDTVEARTYVLEYDPAAYAEALKKKRVEVGDTYVITDPNQARSYLEDRYEWQVSDKSDDVCAVYETKRGAIKAKFNEAGKCKVIWMDKESGDKGKFTFIAKK